MPIILFNNFLVVNWALSFSPDFAILYKQTGIPVKIPCFDIYTLLLWDCKMVLDKYTAIAACLSYEQS